MNCLIRHTTPTRQKVPKRLLQTAAICGLGALAACSGNSSYTKPIEQDLREKYGAKIQNISVTKVDGTSQNLLGRTFYKGEFRLKFTLTELHKGTCFAKVMCPDVKAGNYNYVDDYVLEKWESGWKVSDVQL